MKNSILFAIVTYKERYFECLSYLSLLDSFKTYGSGGVLDIFVFDNTDLESWDLPNYSHTNVNINYVHQNENRGISYAYNRIQSFAIENNFEWIVFLDQDTSLPVETFMVYLNKIQHSFEQLIAVPVVYANHKIISPSRYVSYRSIRLKERPKELIDFENISCINSGLMINTKFFENVGGYNESLKLDFCDHEFVERVKKHIEKLEILNMDFSQNFSPNDNTLDQAISRYKIFVKDYRNYIKGKNKFILFSRVDLPHLLKLTYMYKTSFFIRIRYFSRFKK